MFTKLCIMKALCIENDNHILARDTVIFIPVENAKESVLHIIEGPSSLSAKPELCNAFWV